MYISDPNFDWFKEQVCEIFGFTDKFTPLQESDLYTQYRDAYRHGYNDGYDEGYSNGKEYGYDDGYDDGKEDGYNDDYDEGYNKCKEDVEDGVM